MPASNPNNLDPHVAARRYKVCCGCGSLVAKVKDKYAACHAYRFEEGVEAIQAAIRALQQRSQEGDRGKKD